MDFETILKNLKQYWPHALGTLLVLLGSWLCGTGTGREVLSNAFRSAATTTRPATTPVRTP